MPRCWPLSREALWQTPSPLRTRHQANTQSVDRWDIGPKSVQTLTNLLKWLATNAISWDIGWHSALRIQRLKVKRKAFPHDGSTGLKWSTPASLPVTDNHHGLSVTGYLHQGYKWMGQGGPKISWLTQGLPTLS